MTDSIDDACYLIRRSCGLYWAPYKQGYTGVKDQAGRYTREVAWDITAHGETTMVHEDSIEAPDYTSTCYWDVKADHIAQKDARDAAKDASWSDNENYVVLVDGDRNLIGPYETGYTGIRDHAGRFTAEEAIEVAERHEGTATHIGKVDAYLQSAMWDLRRAHLAEIMKGSMLEEPEQNDWVLEVGKQYLKQNGCELTFDPDEAGVFSTEEAIQLWQRDRESSLREAPGLELENSQAGPAGP